MFQRRAGDEINAKERGQQLIVILHSRPGAVNPFVWPCKGAARQLGGQSNACGPARGSGGAGNPLRVVMQGAAVGRAIPCAWSCKGGQRWGGQSLACGPARGSGGAGNFLACGPARGSAGT